MEKVLKFIKNLFSFSHAEAHGFIRLLIVCIVALAIILVPKFWSHKPAQVSLEESRKLDSLASLLEKAGVSHGEKMLFSFNPNTLSVDSLELLGFPRKLAERVDNYRKKGWEI